MYQKGVANGSQEGKQILSKRAHYRKSVKRSDVIAINGIFDPKIPRKSFFIFNIKFFNAMKDNQNKNDFD